MRCLAVCQTELAIRMLDEILLPSFEIDFLVESKPLARRLHDAGMHVAAADPRRTVACPSTPASSTACAASLCGPGALTSACVPVPTRSCPVPRGYWRSRS